MTTAANVAPLVAIGAADRFLSARPTVTFWKLRVQKHTAFAMEMVSQNIGQARFASSSVSVSLMRTGDLLFNQYLSVTLPSLHVHRRMTGADQDFVLPEALCQDDGMSAPGAKDTAADIFDTASYNGLNKDYKAGEAGVLYPQASWVDSVGFALIRRASVLIGGQLIDQVNSVFLAVWEELSGTPDKDLREMVGMQDGVADQLIKAADKPQQLYIPLPFWYATHSGSALPLVSLQFHSLSLEFEFAPFKDLVRVWTPPNDTLSGVSGTFTKARGFTLNVGGTKYASGVGQQVQSSSFTMPLDAEVYSNYIYLDQQERDLFATGRFLQLAKIHQSESFSIAAGSSTKSNAITFNFPTAQVMWVVQRDAAKQKNQHFNFTAADGSDLVSRCKLSINGMSLCDREAKFYNLLVPYQHNTRLPGAGIYAYSFALSPESVQPSGSLNLSRIDNFTLSLDIAKDSTGKSVLQNESATCTVMAVSLNLIRYGDGLAGPMFGS